MRITEVILTTGIEQEELHVHNRWERLEEFQLMRRSATNQGYNNPSTILDIFEDGRYGMTAAANLAEQNRQVAANFLQEQGSSTPWICYGNARGGHIENVERNLHTATDINWAAAGFAKANFQTMAGELLERGAQINWVAFGAAQYRGTPAARDENWPYVLGLIDRGADIDWITFGAGLTNNRELLIWLQGQRTQLNININIYAMAQACNGHLERAVEAIFSNQRDNRVHVDFVTMGAAVANRIIPEIAGQPRLATALRNRHPNITGNTYTSINMALVVIGSALGGHLFDLDRSGLNPEAPERRVDLIPHVTQWQQEATNLNVAEIIELASQVRTLGPAALFAIMDMQVRNDATPDQNYFGRLANLVNNLQHEATQRAREEALAVNPETSLAARDHTSANALIARQQREARVSQENPAASASNPQPPSPAL